MPEMFAITWFIGLVVFLLVCILLPISAYSAQKYAYKCFRELEKMTRRLEALKR